ncbi:GTPase-activating protein [Wickerhamomyces ciferrii]|uniref:GTPase-activating protein GYP7 n=1 Tax=Wickerhamomyces ciferrii (strain ATCC 14091 / BCRC 22168 / CBS 111 / JCM 3599 / NBRC 0793 / NRRL Y-1031 F-60-10) TaxID=1206466 RepID=K0KL60_WICCF|nr:GTPase-activating protein [Wickerhamomyces ciferrii]CCH41833.1 GTPase-activating protein [Wickerhamomyces ciferrii]
MTYPIGKVKLLYVKSKVYVHPSKNSKLENIPGYLYFTHEQGAQDKDILFGWIPESIVSEDDKPIFDKVDLDNVTDDKKNFVRRPSLLGSFAFGITIRNLFSIQIRPPSLGWWYGSIVINTKTSSDRLPILFFHDDECPSTKNEQNRKNKDFDPFSADNGLFWGGLQMLEFLGSRAVVEKSTLEESILLINPSLTDLNNFSPTNVQNPTKSSKSGESFNFNKFINDTRWSVLETLAKVTKFTKNSVDTVLDESPAPIKKLLKNPEVQRVNEDFDTARVYLAKWAMGVQEEAAKTRKQIILDQNSRDVLAKELGLNFDKLLPEEVLNAHERHREVGKIEWDSFFDKSGRLNITVNEVKDRIFHGGLSNEVRPEAWLFLLEVVPWDTSSEERKDIIEVLRVEYEAIKMKWERNERLWKDEYYKDQKFRIEKDIQRTDRHLEIFKNPNHEPQEGEDDDDFDVSNVKNPHLKILREILLTFNQYNDKLGYVQGMTDLLSPLYVVLQDDALTFHCFVKFMDRMERNFLSDQSGMRDQMNTLNELVQFMLPNLYVHLEKCDSNNLFFFFRMLLVWFKRELPWDDVLRLWEILWTDLYSSQFHLFFALSILQKNEKIIIDHLRQFDEVLKYINDLSMTYNLNDQITRSELLFLKFRKMVEIMDVQKDKDGSISPVNDKLRLLLSKKLVIQKEKERVQG